MRVGPLLLSTLLCLPAMRMCAQFDGEGKPTNDTATIHTTCAVDGTQTIRDDYSGSVYIDHTATRKYLLPIDGARARGEWKEVLRLSDMSVRNAPSCDYAYFSRGQSLLYMCQLADATVAMQKFIDVAAGKEAYASLVGVAKTLLDSLQSGDAAAHCQP